MSFSAPNSFRNKGSSVSVIIPTRNSDQWLERLLSMLNAQTLRPKEVVIVDSSSTDATCAIARKYQTRIITIPPQDFDHGGTRNYAARRTSAEILVFMTQDAIPTDRYALAYLVQPLLEKKEKQNIVATYGRQLPAPEASVFAKHLRLFNYRDRSYVRCWQDRHLYGFKTIFFSNSFAAYKKSVLEEINFFPEHQIFGEDTCAVATLLEQGYCISYVSGALVYHSHNYSLWDEFRRYFDIGVFHTCRHDLLQKFGSPQNSGKEFVYSELFFLWNRKNYTKIPESILRNLAKFIAYHIGKRYRGLPSGARKMLSMQCRSWK